MNTSRQRNRNSNEIRRTVCPHLPTLPPDVALDTPSLRRRDTLIPMSAIQRAAEDELSSLQVRIEIVHPPAQSRRCETARTSVCPLPLHSPEQEREIQICLQKASFQRIPPVLRAYVAI